MSEERADSISEPQAAYGPPELRAIPRLERPISSRRLKPSAVDLLKLGKPLEEPHGLSISQALNEQRSEG